MADFGLSKVKRDEYVTNVTPQRGTLPWIAPEIIRTPNRTTEKVRGRPVMQAPTFCQLPSFTISLCHVCLSWVSDSVSRQAVL